MLELESIWIIEISDTDSIAVDLMYNKVSMNIITWGTEWVISEVWISDFLL